MQAGFALCMGSSAFLILDLTLHGQWHICQVRSQPPCSGSFACLGSHHRLATRKIFTVEVVRASAKKILQQMPRLATLGQGPDSRVQNGSK